MKETGIKIKMKDTGKYVGSATINALYKWYNKCNKPSWYLVANSMARNIVNK